MKKTVPKSETTNSAPEDQNETTEAKNEATVRAILAAMDAGEPAKFDAYCAPDFQIHNPFLSQPGSLKVFKGLMQGQKTAFPDVKTRSGATVFQRKYGLRSRYLQGYQYRPDTGQPAHRQPGGAAFYFYR